MFDNKIFNGIFYSQFISSWVKKQGKIDHRFKEWLRSITINDERIPEEVIKEIYNLGTCGKFELEENIESFRDDCLLSKKDYLKAKKAKLLESEW